MMSAEQSNELENAVVKMSESLVKCLGMLRLSNMVPEGEYMPVAIEGCPADHQGGAVSQTQWTRPTSEQSLQQHNQNQAQEEKIIPQFVSRRSLCLVSSPSFGKQLSHLCGF